MGGPEKARLADALKAASPALVRTAFDLPAKERATIQNALNETFSADVHVRFETAPDLVCGIELATNGLKVGWNIESYLASLEDSVGEVAEGEGEGGGSRRAEAEGSPSRRSKPEPKGEGEPRLRSKPKPEAPVEARSGGPAEARLPSSRAEAPVEPKPRLAQPSRRLPPSAEAKPSQGRQAEPEAEAPVAGAKRRRRLRLSETDGPVEAKPEASRCPNPSIEGGGGKGMSAPQDSLQRAFDDAFAGMGQARETFALRLAPREVGTIVSVANGIAKVSGLPNVGFEELVKFPGGVLGIAFNVDEDEIGVVLLGDYWLSSCGRRG